MKVNFYANLRALVVQPHLEITDPGIDTLRKLVDWLIELHPEIRPHLLDKSDEMHQDLPIFVNGRNPRLIRLGIDVQLSPDDEISLFSPISSGRLNVEVMREPMFGAKE
jgi:molybdopterin converting factor small subunit